MRRYCQVKLLLTGRRNIWYEWVEIQWGERMKKITYSAPAVKKAFKILHAITDSSAGLGVSDLSAMLNIGKSTVLGITSTLEEMGALLRDPVHKKYSVGYTLLELCRKAYAKIELKDVARKPMESLMEKVGETVFLGVLNDDHVTIVDVVESRNEMKITSPPGTRLRLLAPATGKIMLAQMEEKKAREMVNHMGLTRYTPRSKTDPKQFMKEVSETREKGYAIDDEEYILGVRAIATAIPCPPLPPAALWAVGFTSTINDKKMEIVISEIQRTAQEILHALEKISRGGVSV
jgi:DNA-binding IclR family transcriptional regulator